jgi:hypothetical protein
VNVALPVIAEYWVEAGGMIQDERVRCGDAESRLPSPVMREALGNVIAVLEERSVLAKDV